MATPDQGRERCFDCLSAHEFVGWNFLSLEEKRLAISRKPFEWWVV
jgi:hypothetical protein